VSEVQRLLVRAPNWLGDAVMALPALGAVREAFPGRTLIVAATASVAPIFDERTAAAPDEILTIDRAKEQDQLTAAKADAILLLPNSFGSAWLASRSGAPERWGYKAAGRGWLLTRGVSRPRGHVHQVDYYLELVRGLGLGPAVPDGPAELTGEPPRLSPATPHPKPVRRNPKIAARPATLARADVLLSSAGVAAGQRIVGFAPGAAYGHAKRWAPDRVAQVITELSRRGVACVIVGAGADRDTGRAIESSLPPDARVANLVGRTSLRELVGVVARCAAFVSNDSGAMHVAAALGVPLTAIFGPTDERVTAPAGDADLIVRDVFCRPCMLRECPIDHRCMKRIDADTVLRSVTAHLESPQS
jgi:heptosyltransferase II